MPSSSPEYAITKPGTAHNTLRKRDKPLRTYGKRSVSTPEPRGEPPSKKARRQSEEPAHNEDVLKSSHPDPASKCQPSGQAEKDGQSSAQPVEGETRKRQSILSYFRPIAPSENSVTSGEEIEEHEHKEPAPSPPLSSANRPKRKPRLLRLRATSSPLSDAPEDTKDETGGAGEGKRRSGGEEDGQGSRKGDRSSPLHDGGNNRLNQTKGGKAGDEAKRSGTAKTKKAPTVQTTLNISTQGAFAECKVCDTVWNPLYPDDVKYHMKRHATVLRAKRKLEDGL